MTPPDQDNRLDEQFKFPRDTCEQIRKNSYIKQPYSFAIGVFTTIYLITLVINAKNMAVWFVFATLLAFEIAHTFSHAFHFSDNIQTNTIHVLAFISNIAFINYFYNITGKFPNTMFLVIDGGIILFDQYAFHNLGFVWYLGSQLLLFAMPLIYYYSILPKKIKNIIPILLLLLITIMILEANELFNCKTLLAKYPDVPFHFAVEFIGLILFYLIGSTFS